MEEKAIPDRIRNIPWPETVTKLHVHLGGAVPLYRLWEIAVQRGIRGLGSGYEDFINILKIQENETKNLDNYLEIFDTVELIQSGPEAIKESIIIATHRAYRTGGMPNVGPGGEGGAPESLFKIGKLELRFNPMKRTGAVFLKGKHAGLYDVDRVIKAACEATEDLEIGFNNKIQVGLILCFGRDMTYEANKILAEKIQEWRQKTKKIIGIDLAGHESVNPLSSPVQLNEMKSIFDEAGKGLGRTAHIGETPHVDIQTFLKTVDALNPDRVAHPISALRAYWNNKDDRGLKLLQERNIVCELCVKSNLLTQAIHSIAEYKQVLETLDKFNIRYTFSTDSPCLQNTSLAEEFMLLLKNDSASPEQILRSLEVAEESTFLKLSNF